MMRPLQLYFELFQAMRRAKLFSDALYLVTAFDGSVDGGWQPR